MGVSLDAGFAGYRGLGVVAFNGASVGRGKPLTVEQIETVKATYAMTRSFRAAGAAAGCSASAAKDHIAVDDEFEQVRAEKRVDIIAKIAEVQVKILDTMTDEAHLNKASLNDLGVTFGILTDKRLLLSGQATARTETLTVDAPTMLLTPEERERARELRERMIRAST